MPRCILCLNEGQLIEELVVPDCVGGSLKHSLLCEACSSTIRGNIEDAFSNSNFVRLSRQAYRNLKSRRGLQNTYEDRQLSIDFNEPHALSIEHNDISINDANSANLEEVLHQKVVHYYRSSGISEEKIRSKVTHSAQHLLGATPEPTPINCDVESNALVLENIKIAYELAALEFGETYVLNSPIAKRLRCAIQRGRQDEAIIRSGMDLGPLKSILASQDAHYLLLFQNTCIVSIFGTTSSVDFCSENESFVRSIDQALLYVFNPTMRSHEKYLLTDYLMTHAHISPPN